MTVELLSSHVTPAQSHSVPAGPFHPLLLIQAGPPVLLYSAIRASRSELGIAAPAGAATLIAPISATTPKTMDRRDMHPSRSCIGGSVYAGVAGILPHSDLWHASGAGVNRP